MKWTVVFFGSVICLVGSLVILGALAIAGVSANWWWLIPVGCACLLSVAAPRGMKEQTAMQRNSFRDFLEHGVALQPADPADFPPEYAGKIARAADELVAAGMIRVGDFQGPEDGSPFGKKMFRCILRSPDGSLWAEVGAMRPNLSARCLMYLAGHGRYCRQATVEIFSFFTDHSTMDVVNGKAIAVREIPGVRLKWCPGEEPRKLLWTALELRREIEDGGRNPALPLSFESFAEMSRRWALYIMIRSSVLPPPSDEELRREKFSDAAIAKFRGCCERPVCSAPEAQAEVVPVEAAPAEPVPVETPDSVSPASPPIPGEIPLPDLAAAIHEEEMSKFRRSVTNLGIMTLLSAVNVVLIVSGAEVGFPFSAFFPGLAAAVGKGLAEESEVAIFTLCGIGMGISSILIYATCWVLAKKIRCFILVAFLLFLLDSLLLLPFIPGSDASVWIDVAFHLWVLFSLFSGVRAWRALRRYGE